MFVPVSCPRSSYSRSPISTDDFARNSRAVEVAQAFKTDPRAFWTDGSALPGGACTGAVVGFVGGYKEADQSTNRAIREREGISKCGRRTEVGKRKRGGKTYGERFRSLGDLEVREGREPRLDPERRCDGF